MKELLEAGVHFGHQTKRWNPKMKEFIFGQRNGIYIIDLQKTIKVFKEALIFISEVSEKGLDILLVGTKKQAQDIIRDYATQCEALYVNQRWLGGLLTNFDVIRGSVDRLTEMEEMKDDGRWDLLSKKEQSRLEKVFRKLSKNLGGIKRMTGLPGALIVIDSTKEDIAISEAQKLGIPIVAVVDTNGDPENLEYPIPGNDDAVRAIELFTSKISEAILEGKKKRIEKELLEQQEAEEEAETLPMDELAEVASFPEGVIEEPAAVTSASAEEETEPEALSEVALEIPVEEPEPEAAPEPEPIPEPTSEPEAALEAEPGPSPEPELVSTPDSEKAADTESSEEVPKEPPAKKAATKEKKTVKEK